MSTVTLAPPNAILFVFDPDNRGVRIPEYIDGRLVAANNSCVSVGTRADVDGDVTIVLESTFSADLVTGLQRVFSGVMDAPGHRVAIVTSDARTILDQLVSSHRPELEVWADDLRNPARIVVVAR